jgi:hypothetical protein
VAVGLGGSIGIDRARTEVVKAPVVVAGGPVYEPCDVTSVWLTTGGGGTGAAETEAGAL